MSKISIIISPEKEYFISPISEDGNIVVFLSNEQENNVVKIIPENLVEKLKSILITKNEPSLEEAVNVLCKHLREDRELYDSYKANIAMCILDEYDKAAYNDLMPRLATDAAKRFLDLLIKE